MITVITLPSSIPVRKPLNKNKDMYTLDISVLHGTGH